MAEKYISKVRISGENYVIRDKDSYAAAESLGNRVTAVEASIEHITSSTPEKLQEIKS